MAFGNFLLATALIPKTDPQRPGGLHNVAVERHGPQTANRVGDLHRDGVRRAQRDHVTKHSVGNELDRARAESCAEPAIKSGRTAAALQMAEHANACLLAGPLLDFRRHSRANPTEPRLAILLIGRPDKSPAPLTSAFRDDKQRKFFPLLFPPTELCADAFVAKRNFGTQNDVTAAGDARVRGDPAGVTSHDFEHYHAVVAF